jgi:hypothetical protein
MRVVHIISLIARIALMITMVLGLLFWIAQVFAWSALLVFLAQIGFPSIHEVFGTIGVLGLFILGGMAVFTKGSRWTGVGSILYAFLVPAFGMTQTMILVGNLHWLIQAAHLLAGIGAMYLVLGIEKRYQRLRLSDRHVASASPHGMVGIPE